ncbi:MAG TPA: helix-turn-helix domain-containing protein [Candidatus Angelobacter sp.]|nr:helix-turn-helix domain-containing protein [Candidatus Angelobacter sp.]
MTRLEQLENEKRAWSVGEVADFLGYSRNYVYELIHERKIDGWFVGDKGGYRFCPCELAKWVRKKMAENGHNGSSSDKPDTNGKPHRSPDADSRSDGKDNRHP